MKILLFGSTGQVGAAVARALIADPGCTRLTLINRRPAPEFADLPGVEQVILDTAAEDFAARVTDVAQEHAAAACCVGIGRGTAAIPEERLLELEVGIVGAYARGCRAAGTERLAVLLAVGVTPDSAGSRLKYLRVMGKKLSNLLTVGFPELGAFRPGTIVGNRHTPGWLAALVKLLPDLGGYGAIEQETIGRAFARYLTGGGRQQREGLVYYDNRDMRKLAEYGD